MYVDIMYIHTRLENGSASSDDPTVSVAPRRATPRRAGVRRELAEMLTHKVGHSISIQFILIVGFSFPLCTGAVVVVVVAVAAAALAGKAKWKISDLDKEIQATKCKRLSSAKKTQCSADRQPHQAAC